MRMAPLRPGEWDWLLGQFRGLEHDHGFVKRLQQGVIEAGAAIEKAALAHGEQEKFYERARRQAVEQLLLMSAAPVAVFGQEGQQRVEGPRGSAIVHDLLRFQ